MDLIRLKHFLQQQKFTSGQQLPYLTFYKRGQWEVGNRVGTAESQSLVFYKAVSGLYPIYFCLLCSYDQRIKFLLFFWPRAFKLCLWCSEHP